MTTGRAVTSTVTARPTLTIAEASHYLGVTPRFVRTLVQERRIVFYKVGKFVRFSTDDLDVFMQAGRVAVWQP